MTQGKLRSDCTQLFETSGDASADDIGHWGSVWMGTSGDKGHVEPMLFPQEPKPSPLNLE